jgi:hypothetical protein
MQPIKKPLPALFLFSLLVSCSTGKSPLENQQNNHFKNVKEYTIQFDKLIETNFTASSTLYVHKKGDYLILYDAHVDAFRLACIAYSTGKEIWKVPYDVRGYWFYEDKLLIEGHNSLEMLEIATGRSIWKTENCVMHYFFGKAILLEDEVSVVHNDQDAILNLKTNSISSIGAKFIPATLYKQYMNQAMTQKGVVLKNDNGLGEGFYQVAVVEDRETAKDTYIWTLNTESRIFTLSIYGHNHVLFKKHTWTIPENNYTEAHDRAFSGLPEPEKLHGEVHCIGDQIFFYESYENYRWSWGRGCNRLTAIDIATHEIKYQVWGQTPDEKKFQGFHFFNDIILQSDGIMHFQDEPGTFSRFDMKTGKVLDSLSQRFTLFKDYTPGILMGFNYERKQVKDTEYTNKVSITAWDHQKNEYSKTFDFDFKEEYPYDPDVFDDGTIIFNYYDKKLGKDVLYCCKIKLSQ